MKAANLDDRRRMVLPETFPANSAVTIQQIDEDTVLVKRHRPRNDLVIVALERVERLPEDPKWEKVEKAFAESASRGLRPPKF